MRWPMPSRFLPRAAGYEFGVRHRIGMKAGCDQSREMGHIDHEYCAYFVCYTAKSRKVYVSGISARAGYNQSRLAFARYLRYFLVIQPLGLAIHAVEVSIVEGPAHIGFA